MAQPLPPPPGEIEPNAAALLKDAAARASFDGRIFQVLGMVGLPGWQGTMRAALPRLPSFACGALVRFFIIRDEVPQVMLEPAVGGPAVLAAMERAGLAVRTGEGMWRCPYLMVPGTGVLALSDALDGITSEAEAPDEFILTVGRASRYVDDLSVREPCDLAIDLGCGQGFQALRALTHARRAIATDINPRALAFTRANAALNGAGDRVECRQGSFFEPLQDVVGAVDLLTCNPPFIMLPGGHTTALVNPWEGDGMLEHLVRTTPEMLREGAWSTLIGLWEHAELSDWISRIRGWSEGSGCDVLLLQFRTYRPDDYFEQWFAPEVRAASADAWRSLCERRKIGAITFGGVVLRKRSGRNWLRSMFTLINARSGNGSEQLRAYFASQTELEGMDSVEAILDRRLRIAGGWRFDPAQPLPQAVPAGAAPGLALPLQHASNFEMLLKAFDGSMTARQTLAWLHQAGQIPMPPEDPGAARMLGELVASGCLDILPA